MIARVLELTYSAQDLATFASDLGYNGQPFRWDEARRFLIRCELDAACLRLYLGTPEEWQAQGADELLAAFPAPSDAAAYILDTFPIVRRKDEHSHGEYRTKRVILEIYDEMQRASDTRGEADPEAAQQGNVGVVASVLLRVLRCYVAAVVPVAERAPLATRPRYCAPNDGRPREGACSADTGGRGARVDTVLIEGHTDNVPIGPGFRFKDNLDLSAARSATVFRMMQECELELSGLSTSAS